MTHSGEAHSGESSGNNYYNSFQGVSQSALLSLASGNLPDNTSGMITPAHIREVFVSSVNSMIPYNDQGVFQVSTTDKTDYIGSGMGAIVFDTGNDTLNMYQTGTSDYFEGTGGFVSTVTATTGNGVFSVSTASTGTVLTPTPTGAMVFDTTAGTLHIYNGTWLTFSTGGE